MAQKKYQTSKQFAAELTRGVKERFFLFLGEEEGEKDKVINSILSQRFKEYNERLQNTGRFYITDEKSGLDELTSAADFALSGSMFSDNRACIIRNIGNLKTSDAAKNIFSDMMTSTPEGTIIIMTSMANQPPALIGKTHEEGIRIVQFWRNFDSDLFNYIRKYLTDRKISFDDRIIPLLIELTGNDIKKVDEILDMISLAAADTIINDSVIRDLAGDIRGITVFEFTDSLFSKEKRSLAYLKRLLDDNTAELLILNMIARQTESIERYFTLLDDGSSMDEAFAKLGLAAAKLKRERFAIMIKKTGRDDLRRIYPLIARAEHGLKTGMKFDSIVNNPVFVLAAEILIMK